jgi:hypothetical protein
MHFPNVHAPEAASDFPTGTSAETRRSTSITMISILLLMGLKTGAHLFGQPVPEPHQQQEQSEALRQDPPKEVRIVDPAFCENQTRPYIDAGCIKRVEPAPITEQTNTSSPPKLIAAETASPTRQNVRPRDSNVPSNDSPAILPSDSVPATPADTQHVAQQETSHTSDASIMDASSQSNKATAGDADQFWGRPIAANEMEADSDLRHQHFRHRHRHYGRSFGFRF